MSVTVHRIQSMVGPLQRESFDLDGRWTPQQLLEQHRDPRWNSAAPIAAMVGGIRVSGDQWDQVLPDGADVVLTPDLQVEFLTTLALNIVLAGVSYIVNQAILDVPTPDLEDRSSPTYLVDGISTRQGPGFPIPVVYGEHRTGGQIIASSSSDTSPSGWPNLGQPIWSDWIHLLVAYSEGPIHRIGDVDAGACGEINDLGYRERYPNRALPEGLRVNGTVIDSDPEQTRALVHLRMGTLHQSPVRGPVRQASTIYDVDEELTYQTPVVYETLSEVDALDIKLRFPGGLYQLNGTSLGLYKVDFDIKARPIGDTTPWAQIVATRHSTQFAFPTRAAVSQTIRWTAPSRDSYEVRVERVTADDNQTSGTSPSSRSLWKFATEITENDFAWPLVALMGLSLAGSERVSGQISSVTVPVKGRILSRYDGTLEEWIDEEWDDGSINITAKNPAWVIADLLTNTRYGAGRLISRSQLDAESFLALAEYCGALVDDGKGGLEARHTFDGVFDAQSSVWDAVQRVANTCRAAVILWGNQVRVVFDHTRSRVRLFTSAAISDFSMSYIDKTATPTTYDVRIANQELSWDQDTIPQEDPDADLDPYSLAVDTRRRKQIQMYGVTRPSHARREAIYLFRRARYRDLRVSFTVPLEAMGLEIYDRVAVEHWLPRWHASSPTAGTIDDPETYGFRAAAGGSDATSITLDQDLTLVPDKTYHLIVRCDDGTPSPVLTINELGGTHLAGTSLSLTGSSESFTWLAGAQVAIGEANKVVTDIIVTRIEFLDGLVCRVTGERYDERVYDIPSNYAPQEGESGGLEGLDGLESSGTGGEIPDAEELTVTRTGELGTVELGWTWPSGYRDRAHCYLRRSDSNWQLIADTDAPEAKVSGLELGVSYTFAVSLRDRDGVYQDPSEAAQLETTIEEFEPAPPPNIVRLSAAPRDIGYVVEWAPVHSPNLDYYEVRRGPQWHGGEIVARTRDNRLVIDDAPYGYQSVWIRARSRGGLYSPVVAGGELLASQPQGASVLSLDIDIADGALTGTASGCSLNADDELEMDAGEHEATYMSAVLDVGSSARHWWSVLCDQVLEEDWDVEELDFDVRSGEAHWWNAQGREATYGAPGVDFDWDVATEDTAVELLPQLVSGPVGYASPHTRVKVDARFDLDGAGSWTAWQEFRTGYIDAQKMQVRLTLQRQSDHYDLRISALTLAVAS